MVVPVTALYAGLLALVGIVLAAGSGLIRFRTGVSLGGGNDPRQLVAFRRHGNFAEWVPLALILMAILELNRVSETPLHVMGIVLVVARIAHPLGLDAENPRSPLRAVGAAGTTLVVLVAAIWAITTWL